MTTATTDLSAQEVTVLRLAAEGESNQGIADHLCVSKDRTKQLLTQIYGKLQATNRAHAVALAIRHNIL